MANVLFDALFAPHQNNERAFLALRDGATISYKQFVGLSAQLAHALIELGIKPGDRIAAQIAKSPEALALYAACVQAGAVFLPLNTAYTAGEVSYFVSDAQASLLVCDASTYDALTEVASQAGAKLVALLGTGSLLSRAGNHAKQFEAVERGVDDLAAFLYTSGTTGRSKGAMLSHGNLLSNAQTLTAYWQFNQADVLLHALPIFHTHGLFVATNICVLAGASMIYLAAPVIDDMIAQMPNATAMMGVPTFYTRLLSDDRFTRELTAHIRLFVSGSAPLLAETHTQFEATTGHRILERYGMTETNMNTSNPYDGERRAGTVGLPLPGVTVRICAPGTSDEVPVGDVGLIEVKGPNVFKGYWRMPDKTREELRENGYFITGDMGQIDSNGYVTIVGRSKDLIITGGYNVYPKEVELLIDEQASVMESAVIGVAHPDFGEGVVVVVVAAANSIPNEGAILSDIRDRIARFKQPKRLFVIDELPRNAMGKVQKNILRERYRDAFASQQ